MVLYGFQFLTDDYIALRLPPAYIIYYYCYLYCLPNNNRSKSDFVIPEPTTRRERVCRSDETNAFNIIMYKTTYSAYRVLYVYVSLRYIGTYVNNYIKYYTFDIFYAYSVAETIHKLLSYSILSSEVSLAHLHV